LCASTAIAWLPKAAIEGFERGGDEGESGWMVRLKGLDELLAISRRQQHIVKEFG